MITPKFSDEKAALRGWKKWHIVLESTFVLARKLRDKQEKLYISQTGLPNVGSLSARATEGENR